MKKKSCSFEKEINKSLFTGDLKTELKNHMAVCPICMDSVLIYQWMKKFQDFSKKKELPTIEYIWDNTLSSARLEKELIKKAERPLIIPRMISIIIAIVAPVYLVFLNLDGIKNLIKDSAESSLIYTSIVSMVKMVSEMSPFLVPTMAICLLTTILVIFLTGFKPKKRGLFL